MIDPDHTVRLVLLHFGRAAERLHISQPVLSRQIRAPESELGCDLLERTTRSVTLTASGRHLLQTAPALPAASQSTVREVLGVTGVSRSCARSCGSRPRC